MMIDVTVTILLKAQKRKERENQGGRQEALICVGASMIGCVTSRTYLKGACLKITLFFCLFV